MLLHDALAYWAARTPGEAWVARGPRQVSWAQADALTNQVANHLIAAGLVAGDRIAVLGRNEVEVPIVFFGALKAGVVPVPLNARLAPPEWARIVHGSGARMVVVGPDLREPIDAVRTSVPDVESWLSWGAETDGWPSWDDVIGRAPATRPSVHVAADHDACQLYTSGTTGRPKGAIHTHAGLAGVHLRAQSAGIRLEPGETFYLPLPVTLAGGICLALNTWLSGGTVRLDEFDAAAVLGALDEGGAAATVLTPMLLQQCLETQGADHRRYPRLRWILYGGAPAPAALIRRASEVLGCGLIGGYGQTEFFMASALMPEDHARAMCGHEELLLSVGRPLPGVSVAILDPQGEQVAPGERGEVCLRGVGALREYWRDPPSSADVRRDGWHHTADIGLVDADGNLYLVDRANHMIKSGGLNVYPREVEQVIEEVPGVAQVAVIGVPSERWGEAVTALVVRTPGTTVTAADVVDACRGRLGGFKIPKAVEFVEAFPLNANGKILKHELRALVPKP